MLVCQRIALVLGTSGPLSAILSIKEFVSTSASTDLCTELNFFAARIWIHGKRRRPHVPKKRAACLFQPRSELPSGTRSARSPHRTNDPRSLAYRCPRRFRSKGANPAPGKHPPKYFRRDCLRNDIRRQTQGHTMPTIRLVLVQKQLRVLAASALTPCPSPAYGRGELFLACGESPCNAQMVARFAAYYMGIKRAEEDSGQA